MASIMQRLGTSSILLVFTLFPLFLTIETTRTALWAGRTLDDPEDYDGPLLRVIFVRLIALVCALVPRPMWTLGAWAVWAAGTPVRVLFWLWGVGRGHVEIGKRHPDAVKKWYVQTRARRAEMLRLREKDAYA